MMEGIGYFDLYKWAQSVGINMFGSLSLPRECERSHGTEVSLTGTGAIIQKIKKATHPPKNNEMSVGGHVESTHASSRKFSAVLCEDDSSGFQKGLYWFGVKRRHC